MIAVPSLWSQDRKKQPPSRSQMSFVSDCVEVRGSARHTMVRPLLLERGSLAAMMARLLFLVVPFLGGQRMLFLWRRCVGTGGPGLSSTTTALGAEALPAK